MKSFKIGQHTFGPGQPPFTVVEVGINHNGDINLALKMIDIAKASGANAVKFQTFKADEFISDPNLMYTYKSQGKEVTESQLDMFRRYELKVPDWKKIRQRCDDVGIAFMSTPQNASDLEILLELGIDAVKVGSDDFTNLPLMKRYAETKLPLVISSGMGDMAEVYQALNAIGSLDGYPTILLVCTSQYPAAPENLNLLRIKTLREAFPGLPIGFSDHSQGAIGASIAVALGAVFFEKHFTTDRDLPGPDHWFSEDPKSLKEWVDTINIAHTMLGSPFVRPSAVEKEMRPLARRSLVLLRDVAEGEVLSVTNLGLRRPGTGLNPSFFEDVIGQRATRALKKGSQLGFGDFKR